MSLMDELNRISDGISQKIKSSTNESRTRSYLVDPFIRAFGYDVSDPKDVVHEYTADIGGKQREKVDYAIQRDEKPILFIEVKPATTGLSDNHAIQLRRYFGTKSQVRFGILTNGFEYRFYADLDNPNIMDDDPFVTIDLRLLRKDQVNELNIFMKPVFDLERALATAHTLKHLPIFRRLLNEELNPLSEQLIIHFVGKVYKSAVSQSVTDKFAPIVRKAFNEFVNDKIASHPQPAIESGMPRQKPTAKPKHIAGDSVEIPVFAEYKGHPFEATLSYVESNWKASRIRFKGEVLNPSAAGKKAMRSVNPSISGPNGWDFWKLTDPDGNERCIGELRENDELRRRLLS